jgi:dTDP-4-amino-4,6-dideoxygalactose transaminase
MTSGTWDRHRGHSLGYDVVGLGYNYRLDEPRAALLSARLPGLRADIEARRAVTRRYRELLADMDELMLPYTDEEVGRSSCYVMPVMLRDPELRDPLRTMLAEQHGVQTTVLYPSISQFSAYAEPGSSLPRCELAAATQLTLPLYPHLGDERQDRVVAALRVSLAELGGG